jgi:hypothetical protein
MPGAAPAASAAPGKVRPLRSPQLIEIATLKFGVLARKLAMPSKACPRIATSASTRKIQQTGPFLSCDTRQVERRRPGAAAAGARRSTDFADATPSRTAGITT